MPIVAGSELNDDPLAPLSRHAKDLLAEHGDDTPIAWVHRHERFVEKLATPDVTVADLIGDLDPIKAAALKLPYSDERVVHYGLVPRAHRSIFCLNELPDLQARIQVSLFNILQEGDIQVRGFKLRLPLDIQFVFTANPEDYTNRGSIITPLKDRIASQILTHYPRTVETARQITQQEAKLAPQQRETVQVPRLLQDLLETIAFEARESELVDTKSGVSARLTISAYENLVSTVERRILRNGEPSGTARITDFWGVVPSITGKVELVYEGEQSGPYEVALQLLGKAIKKMFLQFFPHPEKLRKGQEKDPYGVINAWFSGGNAVELLNDAPESEYRARLDAVAGLAKLAESRKVPETERYLFMELVLHGLVEFDLIEKSFVEGKFNFRDLLAEMLHSDEEDED
jgi:magnesium chelatase subunit I